MSGRPFAAGERALLIDGRGRRYLVSLAPGGHFHSHMGALPHDDVLGRDEGVAVSTPSGARLVAVRPTLADYVLKMRRGAQVVYPKDVGLILVYADVFPGARVLEAGTGSGALTLALARAAGPDGLVVSYEIRPDHHERAVANVEAWYQALGGKPQSLELRLGDVAESLADDEEFDRLVLDLPEPWRALDAAGGALVPGGIACCYLPTVPQVAQTVDALRAAGFGQVETLEGLVRTWNVDGPSVRPDHRMVAHTGFLVFGRKHSSSGRSARW